MGVIFQTAGYTLRELRHDDAAQIFERFTSIEKVVRYLPIKLHTDKAETEALVAHYIAEEQRAQVRMGVLVDDSRPGWVVGLIGIARFEHAIALSLKVHRDGAGAGRVFCPELIHWLLAFPDVYRVWAYTDCDNKGVQNLLVKMGAKCEGLARRYAVHPNVSSEPRDCHIWSVVR